MDKVSNELLERIEEKLDSDLSEALFKQECQLNDLYDEKIMNLTPEKLKVEQTIIKGKRKLAKKMNNKMIGFEGII